MAIATGTALVIAAGVGAAGAAANAKIQSNAQKRALASQERGDAGALDYEKSRQAIDDKRYQQAFDTYQADRAAWLAGHGGGPSGGGGRSGGLTPSSAFAAGQGQIMDPGSLGSLIGQQPQQQQLSAQEQPTDWNDWRGLGLVQ